MKSKSKANNSNRTLPSTHETGTPVSISLQPADIKQFVAELATYFPGKIELHLTIQNNFSGNSGTINSGTIGGNSQTIGGTSIVCE